MRPAKAQTSLQIRTVWSELSKLLEYSMTVEHRLEFRSFKGGCYITLMYCNRLHAWWSTQSRLATLLSSLIARRWVGLQTLWWFRLKNLSIDEMVGAWSLALCRAHQGLPVGLLLLRYSVLFTVESLSLLYRLVISWFICSRRWCINRLGVFHANQITMCLDPHLNEGWGWRR